MVALCGSLVVDVRLVGARGSRNADAVGVAFCLGAGDGGDIGCGTSMWYADWRSWSRRDIWWLPVVMGTEGAVWVVGMFTSVAPSVSITSLEVVLSVGREVLIDRSGVISEPMSTSVSPSASCSVSRETLATV